MGKKYDNLIQDIADWDNLLLAYKKARKGKRNRAEVQLFSSDLWLHLGNIQNHLLHGTYSMGAYRSFVVYEPKKREILAAPFIDRVVQHAILNVLEPIWNRCMIEETYACRKGKGTHIGAEKIQQWLRDLSKHQPTETIWIVKTDFSGYFRNIRHSDLKMIVRRKIACQKTLLALDSIIDSTPKGVGIPVGNLTSQWLANLLGNEIDQAIKRTLRVKRYLRYMDDCLAIFQTKAEAEFYLSEITRLSTELGLAFSKTSVHRASQGVNMLGYRIWPTHKLIRKRAIVKFRKDIKFILKRQYRSEHLTKLLIKRIKSFHAHTQHANAKKLFNVMCTGLL